MRTRRLLLATGTAALLAWTAAVQGQSQVLPPYPTDPRDPLLNQGPKKVAVGDRVMVSTQLPIVTETALKVLREGGNAFDAFVTAVFLQNVVDYHQVSLFGAMGGLIYEAKTGKYYTFDAYSERPRADTCGTGDASKVAIAGKPRGLEALAKRFGTKPWASYVAPAIAAAEEGVVVTSFMYGNNYSAWVEEDQIQRNKQAREFYMPDGHLVPVGGRWKMPALAATLRKVAEQGADYMYNGEWGQKFVRDAQKRGYCVTLDNMKAYEVRWGDPVRSTYRNLEIISEPPPKKGGIQIGYNLNILENFDLKRMGHYTQSAEALDVIARTLGRVEDDLRYNIADPLAFNQPTHIWLAKDYAKIGADFIRSTMVKPAVDLAPTTATAALWEDAADGPLFVGTVNGVPVFDESNHNVIVDAEGNWISSLHTGHGGAPGVFIDGIRATGSGFQGLTTGPGRRVSANSTGTIVARNGKPWLSIGSPGVPPQPVTEALLNIIDYGMAPREAVDAPRFFAFRSSEHVIEIESRIPDQLRKGAASRGLKLRDVGPYNWNLGSMQVVWRDPATGKLYGVSDPRRLGHSAGF